MGSGSGSSSGGAGSSTKVIDMTGPKKRVLSGYDAIHNRHARPDENSQKSKCLLVSMM